MQVNAKLEEKDKALQNVSKHCYIIPQKMKKYSTLLLNLFYTQARNKFHLQIYFSLVIDHKDQIYLQHFTLEDIFANFLYTRL